MRWTRQELHELSGLTPLEYEILAILSVSDEGWLDRPHLARLVAASRSHLAKTIAGLDRLGYVRRGRSRRDSSVANVGITDRGREILAVAEL